MRSDNLSNLLFNLAQISGRHSRRVRRERKTFFFPGPGGGVLPKMAYTYSLYISLFLPLALERLCFPLIHAHKKQFTRYICTAKVYVTEVLECTSLFTHFWVCWRRDSSDTNMRPHNQQSSSFSRVWT